MDWENNQEFHELPQKKEPLERQEILEGGWLREIVELEEGVTRERIHSMELPDLLEVFDTMSGDPLKDMDLWHGQAEAQSGVVACQEFAARGLLDSDLDETHLMELAKRQGWFEGGTPPAYDGKLLEDLGLSVEKQFDASRESIEQVLESGGKALCTVHGGILEHPELAGMPWLGANRMVQVIGIDRCDPERVQVLVNDPCSPDGAGVAYSWDTFDQAWQVGDRYLLSAYRQPIQGGAT